MQKWYLDQILYLCKKQGYEVILNDGEVVGIEKMDVNVAHRSFNYFVFTKRPDYTGKRGSRASEDQSNLLLSQWNNGKRPAYP